MTKAHSIIPRRIFLDTGTFQAIADCGAFIFDGDFFPEIKDFESEQVPQVLKRSDAQEILESLRGIFFMNQRANFNWIVSENSLNEVDSSGDRWRSVYVRDILDHSLKCLYDDPPTDRAFQMMRTINDKSFGFISENDKKLLLDAAAADCDVFLTIEKRLPKMAETVLRKIPFLIATPPILWRILQPHLKGL